MIKVEKTTKTNIKAKGLQVQNNQITDVETGEIVNIPAMVSSVFGEDYFDFSFTTSVKEESEVDTGEPDEVDIDDIALPKEE